MGMCRGTDEGRVLQRDVEGGRGHIPQHESPIAFHTAKANGEDILNRAGTCQLQPQTHESSVPLLSAGYHAELRGAACWYRAAAGQLVQ